MSDRSGTDVSNARRGGFRAFICLIVLPSLALCAGCSAENGSSAAASSSSVPPGGAPLAVVWRSSYHPTTQVGSINFEFSGQIALVEATDTSTSRISRTPFVATASGNCASVEPGTSLDGTFIVTARSGGQCSIGISDGAASLQQVALLIAVPSALPTPPRAPLTVAWTAGFSQQQQSRIAFPAVGQSANLHATESLAGLPSGTPFAAAVLGHCAQVTPSSAIDGNFVLSATATGRCIVTVSDSTSPIQRSDFAVLVP